MSSCRIQARAAAYCALAAGASPTMAVPIPRIAHSNARIAPVVSAVNGQCGRAAEAAPAPAVDAGVHKEPEGSGRRSPLDSTAPCITSAERSCCSSTMLSLRCCASKNAASSRSSPAVRVSGRDEWSSEESGRSIRPPQCSRRVCPKAPPSAGAGGRKASSPAVCSTRLTFESPFAPDLPTKPPRRSGASLKTQEIPRFSHGSHG